MSNLYRIPQAVLALVRVGFYKQCPQCGAVPVKCDQCHTRRTDKYDGERHNFCGTERKPGIFRDRPVNEIGFYLSFTRAFPTYLCSPQRRVRWGFLWLRKCREPGVHVHQRCERCRWEGIAAPEGSS